MTDMATASHNYNTAQAVQTLEQTANTLSSFAGELQELAKLLQENNGDPRHLHSAMCVLKNVLMNVPIVELARQQTKLELGLNQCEASKQSTFRTKQKK